MASDQKQNQAAALHVMAESLSERGALKKAIECFRAALDLYPEYTLAWEGLARTLAENGEFEEAARAYEQSASRTRGQERMNHLLDVASCCAKVGQLERALGACDKAQGVGSPADLPEVCGAKARILADAGRWEEALDLFQRAYAKRPTWWEFQALAARALARLGRDEQARAALGTIWKEHDEDDTALTVRAEIDSLAGRHREALAAIAEAVEGSYGRDLDEYHAHRWWVKAEVEDRAGKRKEATRSLEQIAKRCVDPTWVGRAKEKLASLKP